MLGLIYRHHRLSIRLKKDQIDETPLPHHSSIDKAIIEKLGRVVSDPSRYLMLVFVTIAEVNPRLRYLNALHHRYADKGFKVVGVSNGTEDQTKQLGQAAGVDFPIISDKTFLLHQAFHIHPAHSHGGLVVLDNHGRIDFFIQSIPVEDQLRQLTEKYALGRISYDSSKDPLTMLFQVGAPLTPLLVSSLDANEHLVLTGDQAANLALVVFTARCASCQLTQFISELAPFQAELVSDRKYRHHRFAVLFTPNFDRALLSGYQQSGGLPSSTYFLDESSLLYDEYATRYEDFTPRPIVVLTEASGTIASVYPLPLRGGN
jgi:hypothetical protein